MPNWPSWTIAKAAQETGYHPEWLRELCRGGKLEYERAGRVYLIKIASLMNYIETLDATDKRVGPWSKDAEGRRVE